MAAALASSLSSPPILPTTTFLLTGNKAPLLEEHPANQNPPASLETPTSIPTATAFSNLLEYAFRTSPTQSQPSPFKVSVIGTSVQIIIPINLAANDLTINLQSSNDLSVWIDASGDLPEVSRIDNGDAPPT